MAKNRVLVVDDEPIVREILCRYLAREGFDVEAVRTASPRCRRSSASAPTWSCST